GLRAQGIEEAGGDGRIEGDVPLAQVLQDDGAGGAQLGADVAPGGAGALGAQWVVVDDDVDGAVGGQRVVAGAGLAVDDGQYVEAGGRELLERGQRNLQHLDHGSVFGAADDSAQGQRRSQARLVLD